MSNPEPGYFRVVFGDLILKADSMAEAHKQLDAKFEAGRVPVLSVERCSISEEEAMGYLKDQGDI